MIIEFDLDHEFRKQHDSELFYEWLEQHVKHRAEVWRTEGDDTLEDGTVVPWQESEWTARRAIYDPNDSSVRPNGHCFRHPGWQAQEYEFIRVHFSDRKEAIHFALQYRIEPKSQSESSFSGRVEI